jgi:predicted CopG family antitoxin
VNSAWSLAKTVKVHDDTHRALKRLKDRTRSRSIDEVVRDMIKSTTGTIVEEVKQNKESELTSYLKD